MLQVRRRCAALVLAACACGDGGRPHPRTPDRTPSPRPAAARRTPPPDSIGSTEAISGLPPVPLARGPLELRVAYPGDDDVIQSGDSNFIFGSTGNGEARVTVNGKPVQVWPNGAWLGWVAVPRDTLPRLRVVARLGSEIRVVTQSLRRARPLRPVARVGAAWLDTLAMSPVGSAWWPRDEYVAVRARAAPGALVRLLLPGGDTVRLVAQPEAQEVSPAIRAFERDTAKLRMPVRTDRYVGIVRGRAFGAVGGFLDQPQSPVSPAAVDSGFPVLEVIRGRDTVRARWPLRLAVLDTVPAVVELRDDPAAETPPDGTVVGRATPGGTYVWFFPVGTHTVATARVGDEVRVRLSPSSNAWVPLAEVRALPSGVPLPSAVVGSTTLSPRSDRVVLRVPVGQRLPFRVAERDRGLSLTVYGAAGDVDWIRYGQVDSLVRRMSWSQPSAGEVTLDLELSAPLWGYRTQWDGTDLLLEVRRPPVIDPQDPFRGLLIAVDPGHPPGGANGPTGLREAEANLAVALRLRTLLLAAGARVLMTRTADAPVDLWQRGQMASDSNAALLVSIHNNAFPDGINPFTNSGTSVFYNHPGSEPLADAVQRALLARLGQRDLGIARGDLALVRPTWMPSVLCEGLFMMIPDHEAALRSPDGQQRYAEGVMAGLRRFLVTRGPP